MKKQFLYSFVFWISFSLNAFGQVNITYQNPTDLFVCGDDGMSFSVNNASGSAITGVTAELQFSSGIQYVPSTVSGATESNISDLENPIFALADIPAGGSVTIDLDMEATCSLVDAINNGFIFSSSITVISSAGNEQVSTNSFSIETGLVVISGVNPITLSGEKGDVLERKITIRNTRLGPISSLRFIDQHVPGFEVDIAGAAVQVNSPVFYEAVLNGNFFTSIGDGDNLFEKDEVLELTEIVEITDCGIPSFTNTSNIIVGWGCDGNVCQSDSILANTQILTSTKEPNVVISREFSLPTNICANEPIEQIFELENIGNLEAENLLITLRSDDTLSYGMDQMSFEIDTNGTWEPFSVNLFEEEMLVGCNATFSKEVVLFLEKIPAGQKIRVRFNAYFCSEVCAGNLPTYSLTYYYLKPCPPGGFDVGGVPVVIDTPKVALRGQMMFDIEMCLYDQQSYPFVHEVKTSALLEPNKFIHVVLDLPWGLFWEPGNSPLLGGIPPSLLEFDTLPNQQITVHMAFPTPFLSDSVTMEYTLTNVCQDPSTYPGAGAAISQSGGVIDVYALEPDCNPCFQIIPNKTVYTTSPTDWMCGYSVCDTAELILSCGCQDPFFPNPGMCWINQMVYDFNTTRLNVGFEDTDDDRIADSNNQADRKDVNLDRFIPGDTMRVTFRGYMAQGGDLSALPYYLYTEAIGSDFPINGGDPYYLPSNVRTLMSNDSIDYITGNVIIKKADGTIYTCKLSQDDYIDQHLVFINEVNTKPEERLDSLTSMRHDFFINFEEIALTGCMPNNEVVTVGDSVIIITDYKYRSNFAPSTPPPLVNLRSTVWGRPFYFVWKDLLPAKQLIDQYSGFRETVTPGLYSIKPCELSTEVRPFAYNILLAKENLFPNEVRPLTKILNYQMAVGPGLNVNSITLEQLELQFGQAIFQNLPLNYTFQNDNLNIGLDAFFEDPIDEGFLLKTKTVFDPSCNFTAPAAGSTKLTTSYSGCLQVPNVYEREYFSNIGYFANRPLLVFNISDTILYIPTTDFDVNFSIKNDRPTNAQNAWVHFSSPNGSLAGLTLLNGGTPLPQIGDVFQLGDITGQQTLNLTLEGTSPNCRAIQVNVQFGWDCDQFTNINEEGCGRDTLSLELRPQFPELELDINQEPASIPLCEESDYYSFEIYNANLGHAYDLLASVKLPQGLNIVNGSCQVAYPTGGGFTNIPDPASLPNNLYRWEIGTLVAGLQANGLTGVGDAPQNSLTIRFKVFAECGFVSNAQPIFGTEGTTPCGSASNVLRKPGDPLNIQGLSASYGVQASITPEIPNVPVICGSESVLNMQLTYDGSPSAGDSIYVLLPQGISYVSGSYVAMQNAVNDQPTIQGNQLIWAASSSINPNETVKFSITVRYDETAGCDDKLITLQARQNTTAFCTTLGAPCDVYVATGEALYNFYSQNPELQVAGFQPIAAANGDLSFTLDLDNVGAVDAPNATIQLYIDANGNGQVDAGEQLVQTINYNQSLAAGASVTISDDLNVAAGDLCRLIGFVPAAENCACDDQSFPIQGFQIDHAASSFCIVQDATLGVSNTSGNTYVWNPAQFLSCTTCAEATFEPDGSVMAGDAFTFVLTETGPNCSIDHVFEVIFSAPSGVTTPSQTICEGDGVLLEASSGATYNWTGPGISNPNQQNQTVTPATTSMYAVTVTTSDGCTGSSEVTITVFDRDTTQLASLQTCEGQPVDIFGQQIEESGEYCMSIATASGCDSMVCVQLNVTPAQTVEERFICEGDSLELFENLWVTEDTMVCRMYTNTFGCDSTLCRSAEKVPNPVNIDPDQVEIEQGDTTTLIAPAGYASYDWRESLAGTTISMEEQVMVSPVDSLNEFALIVTNANGCADTLIYRVLVLPPCDFTNIAIPNAFTPGDGDSVNDVFRAITWESQEEALSLVIFNRWGEKVFASGDAGGVPQWDGTVDGKRAPSDVYVYIFQVGCREERDELTGGVTLLR